MTTTSQPNTQPTATFPQLGRIEVLCRQQGEHPETLAAELFGDDRLKVRLRLLTKRQASRMIGYLECEISKEAVNR